MKILVTGCSGRVGQCVSAHLIDRGFDVRGVDISEPEVAKFDFRLCDLTDYEALKPHVEDVDAVLHLAALASPREGKPQKVFELNDYAAFHVFQACVEAGVRRVVAASSVNAIGFFFGRKAFRLDYLPVDEDHPSFTTDAYSFSKQILEEIGRYFWRRETISGACIRFGAGLNAPVEDFVKARRDSFRSVSKFIDQLCTLPEEERREEVLRIQTAYDQNRAQSPWETGRKWEGMTSAELQCMNMVHNYWSFVDPRDANVGMERALVAAYEGSHPLFILDKHNTIGASSKVLADLFYPGVSLRGELGGTESLVSWKRAESLVGFTAQHSLSPYFGEFKYAD
ncbi:MAG: NAD(P)-dependent oxidoreductase [Candidatus Latescibacteria bacterium]|jgi:hypothetical protein|nr:NAD(P)-dependent oxidoreductase [Candidatus Latescibacterota bacterium]